MAGEIGYFLPGTESLESDYPGFGALESLASGKGITDRAKSEYAAHLLQFQGRLHT